MKRKTSIIILALVMCISFSGLTLADSPLTIYVNGNILNPPVPPQIINGTAMVPLRSVSESLGCSVSWNDSLRLIDISSEPTVHEALEISGPEDFKQDINEALSKMDAVNRASISKYIHQINRDFSFEHATPGHLAIVYPSDNTCYFNGSALDDMKNQVTHDVYIHLLIAYLAHEGTHSYLLDVENIYTEQDIEAICDIAALRAIENAGGSKSGAAYKTFKNAINKKLDL